MFMNAQDRLRDRAIRLGGIIQAPEGSGKQALLDKYRCLVDGDQIVSDHYGVDLHVSITLLITDRSSQDIIRQKFLRHIAGQSIVLTSLKPETIGLLCSARYAYHPCQYPDILESRHVDSKLTRNGIIATMLDYDPHRTYFMEADEFLMDHLAPLLDKENRCIFQTEEHEND